MLIDFKLLLFELNCQLFFSSFFAVAWERGCCFWLKGGKGGGCARGRVLAMEMLRKCQGCVLKCLVCFSGADSCLSQSCFGGTGGKVEELRGQRLVLELRPPAWHRDSRGELLPPSPSAEPDGWSSDKNLGLGSQSCFTMEHTVSGSAGYSSRGRRVEPAGPGCEIERWLLWRPSHKVPTVRYYDIKIPHEESESNIHVLFQEWHTAENWGLQKTTRRFCRAEYNDSAQSHCQELPCQIRHLPEF